MFSYKEDAIPRQELRKARTKKMYPENKIPKEINWLFLYNQWDNEYQMFLQNDVFFIATLIIYVIVSMAWLSFQQL